MTNPNNAAQAAMQEAVSGTDLLRICQQFSPGQDLDLAKAVRAEVLSKLRATVDERAAQEAQRNAAAESYFDARPSLDTVEGRRIYEAGFDRAYVLLSRLRAPVSDIREGFELTYAADADDPTCASDLRHFTNGWQACIMSQVRAPVDERAAVDPCGYVAVKVSAVDWLKDKFPALTIKAGLCERIGGRLYTITRLMRDHDGALGSAPVAVDRQRLRNLVDVVWNEATESTAVPDTPWADRLIDKVFPSLAASAPVAGDVPGDMPTPIWWINYGFHGQVTLRQEEADNARRAGAAVYQYHAAPQASADVGIMVTSLASLAYRYAMTLSFATRHADCDQLEGIARRVTAKLKDEIHAIISGQSGSSY